MLQDPKRGLACGTNRDPAPSSIVRAPQVTSPIGARAPWRVKKEEQDDFMPAAVTQFGFAMQPTEANTNGPGMQTTSEDMNGHVGQVGTSPQSQSRGNQHKYRRRRGRRRDETEETTMALH